MIYTEIEQLLPMWTGYCIGSFAIGFGIGLLWTFFNKLTEKV